MISSCLVVSADTSCMQHAYRHLTFKGRKLVTWVSWRRLFYGHWTCFSMTNSNLLRSFWFCVGVFTIVLVILQLYYVLVDEENSFHFSDHPTSRHDSPQSMEHDDKLKSLLPDVENNEPVHFNYREDQTHHEFDEYDSEFNEKLPEDKDIPVMIWWTPFTMMNKIRKCNLGECYSTQNRSMQTDNRTRSFFFYGTDISTSDLPLPRQGTHEWALLHEESPKNNAILFHEDTIVLFNHTSTFRRYSDFPLTTQYLESIEVLEQKPWYTLEEKTSDKNKASVLYVQSACNAPSDRDTYVQELMKYIKIDSLGRCLNNKELPEEYKDTLTFSDKGFFKIAGKYKFTLAFENAICDDYITEKLWRPLEVGSVPIYRGSPSVLEWMPNNHSIIVVDDFPSPKDLAEYIKQIDADDTSYLKYLDFKQKGGVTNPRLLKHMKERKWNMVDGEATFVSGFECLVCDRIHENLRRDELGLPITKYVADQNHYGCPRPVQFTYPPVKHVDQFERDIWRNEFDENKMIAKALNKAVLSGEKKFYRDNAKQDL